MTSMNLCLRLAGLSLANSLFGLALLLPSAALAQTPAPAKTTPAPATQAPTPAPPGSLAAVPQTTNSGQGSNGQTDGNFTIRTNVNEVNLIFTVTD